MFYTMCRNDRNYGGKNIVADICIILKAFLLWERSSKWMASSKGNENYVIVQGVQRRSIWNEFHETLRIPIINLPCLKSSWSKIPVGFLFLFSFWLDFLMAGNKNWHIILIRKNKEIRQGCNASIRGYRTHLRRWIGIENHWNVQCFHNYPLFY